LSAWPRADGEMAALVRRHEWAGTSLGPLETWPQALQTVVDLVLASAFPMLVLWGRDLVQIYNDAYRELMGAEHPAGLGRTLSASRPEAWRIDEPLYDRVRSGKTLKFEDVLLPLLRDGAAENGWFTITYSPIWDETGAVGGVLVTAAETTEKVRSSSALRRREEALSAIVENAPAMIGYHDRQTRFVWMNAEYERFFSAPRERIVGKTLAEWVGEATFARLQPWVERALRGERVRFEDKATDKHGPGRHGWTEETYVPHFGAEGEVLGYFALVADITSAKRAEEDLRASEEKYRTLFETMGQGYAECEMVRDAEGRALDVRYIDLNPSWERLTGLPVAGVRGRTAREVVPGLEDWWIEMYDRVVTSGMPERMEHEAAPLGRWFEVQVYPGSGDRFSVLYDDITERKRAEAALRASEERQTFLLTLSDALRPLGDPTAIQETAARILGQHLGADRAYYVSIDEARQVATVEQEYRIGDAPSVVGAHAFASYGATLEIMRSGRRVVIEDSEAASDIDAVDRPAYRALSLRAFLNTPLVKVDKLVGAMCVVSATPRCWTEAEVTLVEETAQRTWAAVERARAEAALRESQAQLAAAFESVPVGLAVLDMSGKATVANSQYRRFLPNGVIPSRDPAGAGRWRSWDAEGRLIEPNDFPGARAMRGERVIPGQEMLYTDDDGREIWTRVATVPIRDRNGEVTALASVISDIDALKRNTEALRESEERFQQFAEASTDILWIRDAQTLQWEFLSPAFERVYGLSRETAMCGDDLAQWVSLIVPDDRAHALASLERVRRGETVMFEYRIRRSSDGEMRWIRDADFPLLDQHGRVQRIGGVGDDITHEKRAVERQKLLLAELQHRVRNVLAIVASIVARTGDSADTVEEFQSHMSGRLASLARTQALLTRAAGAGVDLEGLVRDELLAQIADLSRIEVKGPRVTLAPKAAEILTLAVHELATNATKYGALCTPDARIAVGWRQFNEDGQAWLRLTWTEKGVPIASTAPRKEGFGTQLITGRAPYELDGRASLDFVPGGLRCAIAFPLVPGQSILETDVAALNDRKGRAT
jgi:PAS domain S-box-containing protein